jgi:hypothetical protein
LLWKARIAQRGLTLDELPKIFYGEKAKRF